MSEKSIRASNALEDLSADIRQSVIDIREHHDSDQWCYARVYYLRAKMNRIVSGLGAGVPVMKATQ